MRDDAGDGSLMRPMVGTLLPALRGGVSVSTTAPDPEWCAGMLHGGLFFPPLNPGPMVGVGTRRQDGWYIENPWVAPAPMVPCSRLHGWVFGRALQYGGGRSG